MDSARQVSADNSLKQRLRGLASAASGSPGDRTHAVSWLRLVAVAVTFFLPLIVVPGLQRPFSTPKVVLLATVVVLFALLAKFQDLLRWPDLPRAFQAGLAAWLAALGISASLGAFASLEALLLPLLAIGWFLLILVIRPRAEQAITALLVSGGAVACVAVLQFLGLDPFALAGWAASGGTSPRMRVYATLGNPNFVAAFLVALIPATVAARSINQRARLPFALVLGLEIVAVYATGSRAAALALAAACLWIVLLGKLSHWRNTAAAALLVAILLPAFSPSRPLRTTLEGRFYVWRVVAGHLKQIPLFGFGPGAFVLQYAQWETELWKTAPPPAAYARFAGLHDHAHNDYLETLVDHGAAGLIGFFVLSVAFLHFAFRTAKSEPNGLLTGASAGVVALAAVALVDFPLHRPTELFTFWTLIAIVYLRAAEARGTEEKP